MAVEMHTGKGSGMEFHTALMILTMDTRDVNLLLSEATHDTTRPSLPRSKRRWLRGLGECFYAGVHKLEPL